MYESYQQCLHNYIQQDKENYQHIHQHQCNHRIQLLYIRFCNYIQKELGPILFLLNKFHFRCHKELGHHNFDFQDRNFIGISFDVSSISVGSNRGLGIPCLQ